MEKKRFIAHTTTDWCGMDNDYPVLANSIEEAERIADDLALDNLFNYMNIEELAIDLGYNEEDFESNEWQVLLDSIDPCNYVHATTDEFEGDDEEWEQLVNYIGLNEV